MSRKDFYHEHVKAALVAAGWTIEQDPFILPFAESFIRIDLSASRMAENGSKEVIAVEIKNFKEQNKYISEFEKGLGQYLVYQSVLDVEELPHKLFLAVSEIAYEEFFNHPDVARMLTIYQINLLVFDPDTSTIVLWKPHAETGS